MPIGTQGAPMTSAEPMKVADALLRGVFSTPAGRRGLWLFRGDLYQWYGERWERRDEEWLEDLCWKELEDSYYQEIGADGIPRVRRFGPNKQKIDNVVRGLTAKVRVPHSKIPFWIGGGERPNPGSVISFEDKLVDAKSGEIFDRTEEWFDPVTLPVNYEEDAECPRWMECLDEWGNGDAQWGHLLQRWMGYCLISHRRHAKWLLMYGKVRAGKGTICKILEEMVGGSSYMNSSLDDLAGDFGLDGMETSKVLCISEVSDLDTREGERATRVLKNIVGQDPITVNVKYKRQMRNIIVNAAPIVQSNEIPRLPNKGRGLSSKMLVLPFDVSFEGREDVYLIDKLRKELAGIAAWAVRGAMELENEKDVTKRFPVPERAADAVQMYHLQNNPFDHFLAERFVQNKKGFVATELLWEHWRSWVKSNEVRNVHVPRNQLSIRIETQSSWPVYRYRPHGGKRGLRGLSLRRNFEDLS